MALPALAPAPCERCGAEDWLVRRPGPVAGTTQWLRSGGPWRPSATVCGRCGERAPGAARYLTRDDRAPALTLPVRVLTGLLRAVARERTAVPAPWLVLASVAGGAALGAGAAVAGRTGRPLLAAAVGGSCGGVTCWSVFAATALRQRSTWFELRVAALEQVAPVRAAELRLGHHDAVARSAAFPAYGLARWDGPRVLCGHSAEGSPPRVTSLALGHGELHGEDGPWVVVDTAEHRAAVQHAEDLLADAPGGSQWRDGSLLVDGRRVPARWAGDGEHRVAHAVVGGLSVAVRTCAVPVEDLELVLLEDLDAYASWTP